MKKFCFLLCFVSISAVLVADTPPLLNQPITYTPVRALLVSSPPQEAVWVDGIVMSQEDDDLYIIGDPSGQMRIFFCIEDLAKYTLKTGDHIAAWGKVDKNPINANKNELYVEKVFLIPTEATRGKSSTVH